MFSHRLRDAVPLRVGWLIGLGVIGAAQAGTPVDPSAWGPPWDGESFRGHHDATAGVSFEVPFTGFLVEARHFEPELPVEKVKHLLTVSGPSGVDVTLDVWVTPAPVDPAKFLDEHLGFLRDTDTSVVSVALTRQRAAGLLLSQPRSGQAFGRVFALLSLGRRVFRITCLDKDDARARRVFEQVLETFDAEPRP